MNISGGEVAVFPAWWEYIALAMVLGVFLFMLYVVEEDWKLWRRS